MIKKLLVIGVVFLIGWSAHLLYANVLPDGVQVPFAFGGGSEVPSPSDWIGKKQIAVTKSKVTLDIENSVFASYADTNSMDPVLDEDTHGIEIKPVKEKLRVGDIISYRSDALGSVIVHRIVTIGEDELGTYYIVQGDNNRVRDPEKIRFEQIQGVVVALMY